MNRYAHSVVALALLFTASTALAQAERSLDRCMRESTKTVAKHQANVVKVLSKCFQRISKDQIKDNKPTVAAAAKGCAAQLRKIVNTQRPTNTLYEKAKGKIDKACQPARNPHTTDQVLSLTPSGVPQGIKAKNLDSFCISFGGDGAIQSVSEWIDCQLAAVECGARQQVGTQFPRMLEWLPALRAEIDALGSAPKFTDAVLAVDALHQALDGNLDGEMELNCGPGFTDCGNGVVDADEQCDGADLNGASCASLGFANGGNLTCLGNCAYNLNSCFSGTFPKTGQTISQRAGDDGEYQVGPEFSYTDNGDGTITDNNTGLMWEKQSQDNGMHHWQNLFNWENAYAVHLDRMNNKCDGFEGNPALLTTCNSNADCIGVGNGLCGHAGHRDWRLPNRHELQSIINAGTTFPAVHEAFNNNCILGCNVLDCSCTVSNPYWSSTSHVSVNQAWVVIFAYGISNTQGKTVTQQVRAVRGP